MKQFLTIFFLFTALSFAQVDTIVVQGISTGTQIKEALDNANSALQAGDTTYIHNQLLLKMNKSDSTTYLTPADANVAYEPKGIVINDVTYLQDTLTAKLNRSETSAWDKTASNDLTTGTSFDGDVTGDYNSMVVGNDSHTHNGTTLPDSTVFTSEISGDTSDYTLAQMDSLLVLAGTAKQKSDSTASTGYVTQYDLSNIDSTKLPTGGIPESKLEIDNTPTDEYVLTYEVSSGNFIWEADETGGTPDSNSVFLTIYDAAQAYATKSSLISYPDTLSYTFGIMDTTIVGAYPGWKLPYDITITEIAAYTEANTCTFNLEERAETTPNTAGTDVMTSDLAADNNQEEQTSFANAYIAENAWLVPTISATGDVEIFSITVRYVKAD